MHTLSDSKRIVVKVGSTLLVDDFRGLRQSWLNDFLSDVARLYRDGKDVVIVSSGAIALGTKPLGKPLVKLEEYQAAAAIGQIRLAQAYQSELARYDIPIAQLLLTLEDSENRQRYLNASNTLSTLLKHRVIPIINENDSVSTEEICFGDNDRLSARVAQMVKADTLILLSDIDGLYTADPRQNRFAEFIPEVRVISADLEAIAGDSSSNFGSGGMRTKLAAAKIVMSAGVKMVIAKGDCAQPLQQLDGGERATWFVPSTTPAQARKNWIAQHLNPMGRVVLDMGALNALRQGSSLLAAGVTEVSGQFNKGDCVRIVSASGEDVGRGLCNYSGYEAQKIAGKNSAQFRDILGYPSDSELIHRNDLALFDSRERN